MALGLVLANDAALDLLRLILVVEAQEDEAETAPALGELLPHDDGVLDLAKLLEVGEQVRLHGREGQAAHEELHLVFLCRLVERRC